MVEQEAIVTADLSLQICCCGAPLLCGLKHGTLIDQDTRAPSCIPYISYSGSVCLQDYNVGTLTFNVYKQTKWSKMP